MTRVFKRRSIIPWVVMGLVLAGAALTFALLSPASAVPPSPGPVLVGASQGLDAIDVKAAFVPASRSLTVRQTLRLTSRTEEPRNELVLRTWPNAYQSVDTSPLATEESYDRSYPDGFSAGSLVMEEAMVDAGADAVPVVYRYTDKAKTVLSLPLPQPWLPGETLVVHLRYTLNLPNAKNSYGARDGVYAFGNALALPAPWENGAYRADPFEPIGDPFVTDTANFTVAITVPRGYLCAATVWPEKAESGQGQAETVYSFSALAVRDFAFVLSDRFHIAQAMEGDVLVSALADTPSHAKLALKHLRSSLRVYCEQYGAYPYQSLTLAGVNLCWGGMEYPGLVMIGADLFQDSSDPLKLEYAIAHEIAHQWWYAVVGSDQYNQPWQDEALCEYSTLCYMEAVHGMATRDSLYEANVAPSLRVTIPKGVTPGAPLDFFSSMSQYQTLVYNRGAAMLCALDKAMGGGLEGFLQAYYARFAFQRATRQDFSSLLANYTGEDFEPLMIDYLDTYMNSY